MSHPASRRNALRNFPVYLRGNKELKLKTDNKNEVRDFENILYRRLKDFDVERVSIRKIEIEKLISI